MDFTPTTLWLPRTPRDSSAAVAIDLKYQIKTLMVSAEATISNRDGVVRARASAKIPLKAPFTYHCDVESNAASDGVCRFSAFKESHGDSHRVGVVSGDALAIDGQPVNLAPGLQTLVVMAQAPYALRDAGDFELAYLCLLVGRHPHLVRFTRTAPGRYQISALGLKSRDAIPVDPSGLDWKRAHGAEIKVRDGLIDEIRVSIPLMGAVVIQRV